MKAKNAFFALILIFYEILGLRFSFFPPLYGLIFCYIFFRLKNRKKTYEKLDFRVYFCFFLLIFNDLIFGLFAFISWLGFFIFYFFCADFLRLKLNAKSLISIIFVFFSYFLIFILQNIFASFKDEFFWPFSLLNLLFICFEALLAYVIFKDKFQ